MPGVAHRRERERERERVTDTRERAARETGRRGTGVERPGALWVEREGTRPRDEPGLSIVILVRYVLKKYAAGLNESLRKSMEY